jgi:hypothetical protein
MDNEHQQTEARYHQNIHEETKRELFHTIMARVYTHDNGKANNTCDMM